MSDGAVVDASVAIKWVVNEPYSAQARALREDTAARREPLLAPPHFTGEVMNGLYRRIYRANETALTEAQASRAVNAFLELPIDILTPADLHARAFDFARAHRLASVYDSLYVTLAQLVGVDLWTADERLLNSVRGIAPAVRWIGDYVASRP